MSVTILPREGGATVRCNRCGTARLTTGQILKTAIRVYARSQGWIRGLRRSKPANTRHDICPSCAPLEKQDAANRKRMTEEKRRARWRTLEQKKARRNDQARARRAERKAEAQAT